MRAWVEAFNRADVDTLASLYEEDAINHQVAESPVKGRSARECLEEGSNIIRPRMSTDG